MNPNSQPILQTLWNHRNTWDGKIVIWGSIVQIPFAIYLFIKAWFIFPQSGTDELLVAAFLHLATPVALVGTYVFRSAQLNFRPSKFLTTLLLLYVAAPFFLSWPLLK
jgi:hypothetical protein